PCWIGPQDPRLPTTSRTRPAGSPATATTRGTPSHPHARIPLRTPATTPTTPAHRHHERSRLPCPAAGERALGLPRARRLCEGRIPFPERSAGLLQGHGVRGPLR